MWTLFIWAFALGISLTIWEPNEGPAAFIISLTVALAEPVISGAESLFDFVLGILGLLFVIGLFIGLPMAIVSAILNLARR